MRGDLAFLARRHSSEFERCHRTPDLLANFASSTWSQNGEDGMLQELFRRLDVAQGYFVEIGAADGTENCTRALVERGWTGVWLEADQVASDAAASLHLNGVNVINATVTPDNVVGVLSGTVGDQAVDLLVVDIDSQDWRVLRAVLCRYRPLVVVAEYNAAFRPGEWWVISRRRASWDRTFRHGASLDAMTSVADAFGYGLASCDPTGVNAFFVRDDKGPRHGRSAADQARELYTAPWFTSQPSGHLCTGSGLDPMAPLSVEQLSRIRLSGAQREVRIGTLRAGSPFGFSVVVSNESAAVLSSGEPAPFNLSARWLSGSDTSMDAAARRVSLPFAVPPGRTRRIFAWLPSPTEPGAYRLRITAVQEGVSWVEELGDAGWVEIPVTVVASPVALAVDPHRHRHRGNS